MHPINGRERVLALPGLLTNALIEKFVCIDEVPSASCAPRAWTRDVMAGLVPAIHVFARRSTDLAERDARNKSGHDGGSDGAEQKRRQRSPVLPLRPWGRRGPE